MEETLKENQVSQIQQCLRLHGHLRSAMRYLYLQQVTHHLLHGVKRPLCLCTFLFANHNTVS